MCRCLTRSHREGRGGGVVQGVSRGKSGDRTLPHSAVSNREQPCLGRHLHLSVRNTLSDLSQLMESHVS